MKLISLKPCPFCGSIEIDLFSVDDHLADNGVWKIRCWDCNVTMEEAYLIGNYSKGDKPQMMDSIIRKWNRRKHEIRRELTKGRKKDRST